MPPETRSLPTAPPPPPQQPSEDVTACDTTGGAALGKPRLPRPALASSRKAIRTDEPASIAVILSLALPTLIEQLLSAGVGITDTVVAGNTGSDEAYRTAAAAAVGTMTYLQWFAGLMTSALGVGATAIVARSIGARRPRVANRVAGTACTGAFLIGLCIALLFFFFARFVCTIAGMRGLAADLGVQYLQIMSITVCFQTAGQIGMACLRGAGDTIRPMLVTAAVVVVNGIASPALSFGLFGLPEMGIRGNAIGTLLAFAVAGIVTAYFLLAGSGGIELRLRHFRIVPHVLKRVLRIGMPSWLEMMLLWGGQILIVMFVISPNDTAIGLNGATMAAHTATLRIESLAFLPGFGFGIAASALVGQYLGAGKPQEAQRAAVLTNRLAFITMSIAAIPMVFFPHVMMRLMVNSQVVVDTGTIPLIIAGLAQPGFAIAIVMASALKGAGDTIKPMLSTITGMILRLLLVFPIVGLFNAAGHRGWGLIAVWICIFIDLNYRAIFNGLVFRTGRWKLAKV